MKQPFRVESNIIEVDDTQSHLGRGTPFAIPDTSPEKSLVEYPSSSPPRIGREDPDLLGVQKERSEARTSVTPGF